MSHAYDYIAKLVVIGDSGTGKSSLSIRLCEGRFSSHHDVTIGVEFGSCIVPVGPKPAETLPDPSRPLSKAALSSMDPRQKRMKLSLWDTAGQETYKSITRSYFRGAGGALLVIDITRRSTFEHAIEWLRDLRQIAEEGIVVVLVGNKADLAPASTTAENTGLESKKRAVTVNEAEEWCKKEGVLRYVETSAKSGEGVEDAFLGVAERIWKGIEEGNYDLKDRRSGVKGSGPSFRTQKRGVDLVGAKSGSESEGLGGRCC